MTVAELITRLQQYPQNRRVVLDIEQVKDNGTLWVSQPAKEVREEGLNAEIVVTIYGDDD